MNKKYIALLFSLMAATAPTTVVQSAETPKNEMKRTNKDSKMKKTILFAALGIVIIFVSILGYINRKNLVRWFNPRKHTHSHKRTNDWNDSDDGESSSDDNDDNDSDNSNLLRNRGRKRKKSHTIQINDSDGNLSSSDIDNYDDFINGSIDNNDNSND